MRYIDLIVQTILIVGGITWAIVELALSDSMFPILVTQFCLGIWQMFSCFISIIFQGTVWRSKARYFVAALLYLALLAILFTSDVLDSAVMTGVLLIVPAWLLAFYYYFLTWKSVLPQKRGGFLPNLSF